MARTDKENRTTGYDYDNLNRLVKVTDAVLRETDYTYDNRDNLLSLTDAENQTTRFEYDRNNRLVKEIRPGLQETSYAYDAAGNLVQKIDAKNQKTEYEYDDAGRLKHIRYFATADDIAPAKTVTFTYDEAGNLTGYDDGTTSAIYSYDDLHRKDRRDGQLRPVPAHKRLHLLQQRPEKDLHRPGQRQLHLHLRCGQPTVRR